jgi:hypothetical protein
MNTTSPVPHLNSIRRLIEHATGAMAGDLELIENIMRDDIFHSTLDWQTRDQLADAARQAFALLNDNRELYEFGQASALKVFHQMRTARTPNH